MKRTFSTVMPVHVDIDMDTVKNIKFLFCQNMNRLLFTYPSEQAMLNEQTGNIDLLWSKNDTAMFSSGKVEMDTRITLLDSDTNPETVIVSFIMSPTLFTQKEISDD